MNQKDIERMGKTICESDFCKRFVRRDAWLSGCSTIVHPVMVWKRDIEIQLADRYAKGRAESFRSLFRRLKREFPRITALFSRGRDCPATYTIFFN